jgi:hypothetical protein
MQEKGELAKVAIKYEAKGKVSRRATVKWKSPGLLLRRLIDRRAKARTSGSALHASRCPRWRAGSGYRRTAAFRNKAQYTGHHLDNSAGIFLLGHGDDMQRGALSVEPAMSIMRCWCHTSDIE